MQDSVDDFETTVPTDLTVSSISDGHLKKEKHSRKSETHSKGRKQYLREIQLLNLELSRKNILIDSLKNELITKTDLLEEKLKETVHQKNITQAKLSTHIRIYEEDYNSKLTFLKKELSATIKCKENCEETLSRLRHSLETFTINDQSVLKLKLQPRDSLDLIDLLSLKIYENLWKYKKENDDLYHKIKTTENQFSKCLENHKRNQEQLQKEKEDHRMMKEKHSKLLQELNELKSHVKHGNYAQENFSRVESERDRLNIELLDMKRIQDNMKIVQAQTELEKDIAKEEIIDLKSKNVMLQTDCNNLSKQLSCMTQKLGEYQDKVLHLQRKLQCNDTAKEEHIKLLSTSRDKLKLEYEARLADEKTRINNSLAIFYEGEIRSLVEAKQDAIRAKETAENSVTVLKSKYEKLYNELQERSEEATCEIKKFKEKVDAAQVEVQKSTTALNLLQTAHREKCNDYNQISIKLEMTEKEVTQLKATASERVQQLESDLGITKGRLHVFEKMDGEFRELIAEVAQVEDMNSERVLKDVAEQMSVPASLQASFIQCVQLTRNIIQLERSVSSLQNALDVERMKSSHFERELSKASNLLDKIDQPASHLIMTVQNHESYIRDLQGKVAELTGEVQSLADEKRKLLEERNSLVTDLKNVIENRKEIMKIKEVIESMEKQKISSPPKSVKKSTVRQVMPKSRGSAHIPMRSLPRR